MTYEQAIINAKSATGRKSRSYADYERGKRILVAAGLSPKDYQRGVRELAKWVGV